jgi:hypothetical protein
MGQYTLAQPVVSKDYEYSLDQCDVNDKASLMTFREKRRAWLVWLETDEHHAIWDVLSTMVWRDVSFRCIAELANSNPDSGLHNSLLTESLLTGYFATQVLAIRRLMDDANRDVISFPRILKDIRRNLQRFTRENVVGFDGLPYDYQGAQQRVMVRQLSQGGGPFWGAQSGPDAHGPAQRAHEQFDRLTGVRPDERRRDDRLPKAVIDKLKGWLKDSQADEIVIWSHNLLAHAAGPTAPNRSVIAAAGPTADKITNCIKVFVKVAEALTGPILFHSGRGMLVPVPQFNQFEKLENSLMANDARKMIGAYWDRLADERNGYLKEIEEELTAQKASSTSTS